MHDIAPFAGFSISIIDFIAELFSSAFLFFYEKTFTKLLII